MSARDVARRPGQFGLSVLGIALGVAVVVAVDLANGSAQRAFLLSNETVLGRTTDVIAGGRDGFSEGVYARLRRAGRLPPAAPVVEGPVRLASDPRRRLRLLGVDPLSEAPFRPYLSGRAGFSRGVVARLLTRPGSVAIPRRLARELGLEPGGELALVAAGEPVTVTVAAYIGGAGRFEQKVTSDLLVADIATAQELLGRVGRLDRIDLVLPRGEDRAAALARLRARLPPALEIRPASRRAKVAADMTRAFNLNLTMMSLLALLVGMLLIFNAVTFSVIRRRALLGTLRALGITRGEIFAMVLAEAGLVGVVGTGLGLGLGIWLAQGLLELVSRTINDLYFEVAVSAVYLAPWSLAKGLGLGIAASLLAALAPAREATRVSPRAALSRSVIEAAVRGSIPRLTAAGAAGLGAAGLLLAWPGGGLAAGFGALFLIVVGSVLLVPVAVAGITGAVDRLAAGRIGALAALAVRGVTANLSRTAVAMAALMVALATTVGVGIMVDSFRHSVASWLRATLRADIYVARPGHSGAPGIAPEVAVRLAGVTGVAHASWGRAVTVDSPHGPVNLVALRMAPESYAGFTFVRGRPAAAWPAFDDRGAVLISEPLAYRLRLGPGDVVVLRTDRGRRAFRIAGVIRDYSSDRGIVLMSRRTYDRFWSDRRYGSLGIYARAGTDPEALVARLRAAAGADHPLVIRSNRALREASMTIFDRTFEITRVLRGLTVIVAFVGVLSALMALELERLREVGLLRAIGLTRGQIWGLVEMQTALMGLISGLLALPLGLLLALVLIHVINRRSFGWSMDVSVDPVILLQAVLLAVAAAVCAGLYPAAKMAGTRPAVALREE